MHVAAPVLIDHQAIFDDVVAVARKAHAATAGWRAICVRVTRTIGKKVVQPLSMLDLDEEIPALSDRVRSIVRLAPREIDTLVFGIFDGVDDGDGLYTGFHVGGSEGFDPGSRWLSKAPTWLPEDRFLKSPSLDALARAAASARGEAKRAVSHSLRFGAAALLARFASAGLPHRVVVAFDDGDFAEITGHETAPEEATDRQPSAVVAAGSDVTRGR